MYVYMYVQKENDLLLFYVFGRSTQHTQHTHSEEELYKNEMKRQ